MTLNKLFTDPGPHQLCWRLRPHPPHHLSLLAGCGRPQRGSEASPSQVRHKLLSASTSGFQSNNFKDISGYLLLTTIYLGFGSSFLYSKFRIRFRKITNSFNLHESAETSRFQSKIACSLRKLFFLNTYFSGCSHFEE